MARYDEKYPTDEERQELVRLFPWRDPEAAANEHVPAEQDFRPATMIVGGLASTAYLFLAGAGAIVWHSSVGFVFVLITAALCYASAFVQLAWPRFDSLAVALVVLSVATGGLAAIALLAAM